MTTLVTGATGFLGSAVARALRVRGNDVRVLARPTSDLRRLDGLGCEVVTGDVTDRASVESATDGCDLVVHVAALYEFGTPDAAVMERINVDGTRNVLEAAASRGARAVHTSSTIALGPTGTEPVDETWWHSSPPASPYGDTKRRAHLLAREMARGGADIVICSPAAVYGPDDPSILGTFHEVFARFPMPVAAMRSSKIAFVHVDDCADAMLRAADKAPAGAEYVLGERVVRFGDWFEVASRAAGHRPPLVYLPTRLVLAAGPLFARLAPLAGVPSRLVTEGLGLATGNWAYDSTKAKTELGWEPRSLADGVAETIRWYRDRR